MPRLGAFARALAEVRIPQSLGASAAAFARCGIPVFPCEPNGKRPLVPGGFHAASADAEHVAGWWARTPSANIGVPTGTASGIVVLDVDVHGRANGFEALDRARRAGFLVGWEAMVRTPSGGLHVDYPAMPGVEQRSWQAARAGIDLRGDGGYIIAPPSHRIISGREVRYETVAMGSGVAQGVDSDALRDLVVPRRPVRSAGSVPSMPGSIDVERIARWVARRQEGERNHGLFWAACTMAEHQVPVDDALDLLTTAGTQAGLSSREVATTVRSAYRAVHRVPLRPSARQDPTLVPDEPTHDRSVRALP
ncbi:bifunctional DNA primase/polymerase [Microbacterium sp. 2MCAF23]|uniref:bifunctional DNA primase/polymerase n=1 Tax=Microbacterium sp. 2MCAF23 TaxID=3232985 RepID=UPI003F9567E9